MNICFVNSSFPSPTVGGVERVTHDLATALSAKGHRVDIVIIEGTLPQGVDQAYTCHLVPEPGYWGSIKNSEAFRNLLREHQIQVIVVQSEKLPAIELVESCLDCCVKVVSVFHTAPFCDCGRWNDKIVPEIWRHGKVVTILKSPYHYFRYIINRHISCSWGRMKLQRQYKISDKFITLSVLFHPRLIEFLKIDDPSKFGAIPNPVPSCCVTEEEIAYKENIILWVGRMNFCQKRPDRMIQIWERIAFFHTDWKLVMIGDGDAKDILEKYCKRHQVPRVLFTGKVDPYPYYKKAKLLCMTSSWEGWGLVLTEGMSFGCVPIAYNSYESLKDIISNNENGIMVPAYDKKTFINELNRLINNDEYRCHLAINGLKSIKRYELDAVVCQWENLFKQLLI